VIEFGLCSGWMVVGPPLIDSPSPGWAWGEAPAVLRHSSMLTILTFWTETDTFRINVYSDVAVFLRVYSARLRRQCGSQTRSFLLARQVVFGRTHWLKSSR